MKKTDSHNHDPDDAWELLSPRFTEKRRDRMIKVAQNRTNHVRLALQDIHDPHNISACFRTAEALGVHKIDIINLYQKFTKPSTVARGSEKWLKVNRWTSIDDYVAAIREDNYLLAAGFPSSQETTPLEQIPITQPVVVLFGNEHQGVNKEWKKHIDIRFTIPMYGMVESFNISVSAALSLYALTQKAKNILSHNDYVIDTAEQQALLASWARKHSRNEKQELNHLRANKHKEP